jgi:hypothetical protein
MKEEFPTSEHEKKTAKDTKRILKGAPTTLNRRPASDEDIVGNNPANLY